MKKFLLLFLLTAACLVLAGCGRGRALSPEELKEEIARSVPKEGFQPFKEISPAISVKSYGRKRPYDLFAPVPDEKADEEKKTAVAPVPAAEEKPITEITEPLTKEEEIALAPESIRKEPVPEKLPEPLKTAPSKKNVTPEPEQLVAFNGWNGECLIYQITWNSIRFGKGMLACKETSNGYGETFHIIGLTVPEPRAAGLGIGLYRMDAFIDKKTLLPHYYYQYGKNKTKEDILEIRFDWDKKFYRTKYRKFDNGRLYSTKEERIDMKNDVAYDGISIFYVVRTLDLDNNCSFTIPIAFRELWDLTIKTAGRRTENIPCIGKQEVYVLKPQAQGNEGLFTKGAMDLWITTDKKRLPVNLEGKVPLGRARMFLISEMKLAPDVSLDTATITEILSRFN